MWLELKNSNLLREKVFIPILCPNILEKSNKLLNTFCQRKYLCFLYDVL